MTHPRQLRNQIHALGEMHANITHRLAGFIAATHAALEQHDGYPTTASGSDTGGGTTGRSTDSSTERAVFGRLGHGNHAGPVRARDDVVDFLQSAVVAYDNVLKIFDEYVTRLTDEDKRRMRCTGDGTPDGAVCDSWAEPGRRGMCIRCYTRSRRATSATSDERAA
jgi:hypothetical protein